MKRVALFERVSTEEQSRYGFSIDTQIDALTKYCTANHMKIVDHYTDEGVSAGKPYKKRPEMKRLLDDVEAGKIDLILFTRLDRWFRNVHEYFKVQDILDAHNVQWKAIWEDYDTTTANGRMAITIFLAIAQNEREKTAERINVVLAHKRQKKEACFGGGVPPMGYKKEKDSDGITRLVKDPETQHIVERFWDHLLKTYNMNGTIRLMADEFDIHKDWKSWKRMSQSEFYAGRYKGIEGFCEPYITPEDFDSFQRTHTVKQTPSGRTYLFTGMIACPKCGARLCGSGMIRNGKEYKSYRCRDRGRGCNNQGSISERKIERQLLSRMNEFLQGAIATAEIQSIPAQKKTDTKKIRERIRRLDVVYMNGNLTDEEYLKRMSDLKIELAKAEKETPTEAVNIPALKAMLNVDFQTIYQSLDEAERQTFWKRLISEIEMDGSIVKAVTFTV